MAKDAHGNRLRLFLLIHAGILSLFVVGGVASVIYFYGSWFGSDTIPSLEDLGNTLNSPYVVHLGLIVVFLAVAIAVYVIAVTAIVLDIRLAKRLWRGQAPQRNIIIASVFNLLSGLVGGILLIPFGAAIGIYGLWYAFSCQRSAVDVQEDFRSNTEN